MTHDEVIKALGKLAANWPKDLWLFAGEGSLSLMELRNGERAVLRHGGMDPDAEIASFNIPSDGGAW